MTSAPPSKRKTSAASSTAVNDSRSPSLSVTEPVEVPRLLPCGGGQRKVIPDFFTLQKFGNDFSSVRNADTIGQKASDKTMPKVKEKGIFKS